MGIKNETIKLEMQDMHTIYKHSIKNCLQIYVSSSHHSGTKAGPIPSTKPQVLGYQVSLILPYF